MARLAKDFGQHRVCPDMEASKISCKAIATAVHPEWVLAYLVISSLCSAFRAAQNYVATC